MKKVLIVLLSVLLALSFVSCESDKSEEIIAVYDEYVRGSNFTWNAYYSFNGLYDTKDGETTLNGGTITQTGNVGSLIRIVDDISSLSVTEAVAKSGTIKVSSESTETTYEKKYTFVDCVIDATYDDYSGEEKKEGEQTTFSINGSRSYLYNYNDEDKTKMVSWTNCYDFTVGDLSYKVEYEYDKDDNITSAKVNGKSVDLRLVNAGN